MLSIHTKLPPQALVQLLTRRISPHPLAAPGQIFDSELLTHSRVYRTSREEFLRVGGKLAPSFISRPRSLTEPTILNPILYYTPLEDEVRWYLKGAKGPAARASIAASITMLFTQHYCSLFHEQNHRIVANWFPPSPSLLHHPRSLRHYLNAMETLVLLLDAVVAEDLPRRWIDPLAKLSVLYRGRDFPCQIHKIENLEIAVLIAQTMWMRLMGQPDDKVVETLTPFYSLPKKTMVRALKNGLVHNPGFDQGTNPGWLKHHSQRALKAWGKNSSAALTHSELSTEARMLTTLRRLTEQTMERFLCRRE